MRTLKVLIALGIVAAGIYVGIQLIPPLFANYRFQDAIENEAMISSYTTKTEEEVRQSVLKKAQDLEIPLTAEQITVQRESNRSLTIKAEYTVHVDLPGYPVDLDFHPGSKNKPI
jgi:hypothetical protein